MCDFRDGTVLGDVEIEAVPREGGSSSLVEENVIGELRMWAVVWIVPWMVKSHKTVRSAYRGRKIRSQVPKPSLHEQLGGHYNEDSEMVYLSVTSFKEAELFYFFFVFFFFTRGQMNKDIQEALIIKEKIAPAFQP